MLFHIFNSQEERRAYGGSGFIEIQFCRTSSDNSMTDCETLQDIHHWQDDSLYVDDGDSFYNEYHHVFDLLDMYGMNYFGPKSINPAIEKLIQEKPMDYEILVEWLGKAKEYNGFYILGL